MQRVFLLVITITTPGLGLSLPGLDRNFTMSGTVNEEDQYMCACQPAFNCIPNKNYCNTSRGAGCFALNGEDGIRKGCGADKEKHLLNCQGRRNVVWRPDSGGPNLVVKCCAYNLCNVDVEDLTLPPKVVAEETTFNMNMLMAVLVPIGVLIVAVVIVVLVFRHLQKRQPGSQESPRVREELLPQEYGGIRVTQVGDSTLQELIDESCTSGSGSGLPFLVQATVARSISLIECIGKGRYGSVWRGRYHDENLAVKIFSSRDEASWLRETEIYNTCLLRHEGILGYYASDMTSRNSCTQLWLIMHYHENGSLYDYLQSTTLDWEEMLRLCHSAAAGLVHLHTEIVGNQGKAAIAHRDIKSKNILVKGNGTCCIGDLGLAVTHTQENNKIDLGRNNKVGTKRYMAPELLDETLNPEYFEAFKQVDVYAFGLVIWEVARRCVTEGMVDDYKPPFWDVVPSDPSFDDMKKVVVIDQQRPAIPNRWSSDTILLQMSKLIQECWMCNPKARLTSLRIKKTINQLLNQPQCKKIKDTNKC
ncbi:activin receptor type-1-like isoform X1 [Saccostrea echinata]|uniref:activin receptor type-1-like isoform X1 n=2 Tax=Saccostrea echinata TaxID=191078 RepID=UPI002A80ECD0|nr:activin receptor type-1-like isoform X1 [Saccostrea echinata]